MVKSELDKLTASTLDEIKERFKKKGKKLVTCVKYKDGWTYRRTGERMYLGLFLW